MIIADGLDGKADGQKPLDPAFAADRDGHRIKLHIADLGLFFPVFAALAFKSIGA